ncbi:MAG: hypothetical protein WC593_07370 [Methanoregula sp.]
MDFDIWQSSGYIIGILGLIGTLYFGYVSIKKKKPVFTRTNNNIITNNIPFFPGLNILYNGETIQNLSSTIIRFWNNGNDRIDKTDISTIDPLRIQAKENVKIFIVAVNKYSNFANALVVSPVFDNKYSNISFDYLSKEDGAEIIVIHSGKIAEDIEIKGTIKDANSPVDLDLLYSKPLYKLLLVTIPDIVAFPLIIIFATVIIRPNDLVSFFVYIICILIIAFFSAGGWYKIRDLRKSPKFLKQK